MKKYVLILTTFFLVSGAFTVAAQDKKESKITVEITKEINGEKKTFKGEYENEEQMRADPNYQEFAGEDSGFNFWFGRDDDSEDVFIHLDQMMDKARTKMHFSFDDSSNVFFRHRDADSSFFRSWNLKKLLEENAENMGDVGEEIEILLERLKDSEGSSSHVFVFSSKKIKVVDVEEGEFGEKGDVKESHKLELEDLKFFPNPSSNGRFNVRFRVPQENELSIKVFNLEGKEVYNRYFERFGGTYSESLDLSGQSEGIYLLEISQGNKRLTKKIVINKQ